LFHPQTSYAPNLKKRNAASEIQHKNRSCYLERCAVRCEDNAGPEQTDSSDSITSKNYQPTAVEESKPTMDPNSSPWSYAYNRIVPASAGSSGGTTGPTATAAGAAATAQPGGRQSAD